MNKNKISIALCTYNGQQFLEQQLISILEQYHLPNELVVVDDASTDKTMKILQEFQEKAPFEVNIYQNEVNLGFIKNFQKAVSLCKNQYVFLSDQDDIWEKDKLKTVMNMFQKNENVDLIVHDMQLVTEENKVIPMTIWDVLAFNQFREKYASNNDLLNRFLVFGNTVSGASMAFKKNNLKISWKNNFPVLMAHDFQILLFFLMKGNVMFLKNKLVNYRLHKNQKIGVKPHEKENREKQMQSFYERENPRRNIYMIWNSYLQFKRVFLEETCRSLFLKKAKQYHEEEMKKYLDSIPFFMKIAFLSKWRWNKKYDIDYKKFIKLLK